MRKRSQGLCNYYRLVDAAEVDGEGAMVLAWTESVHGDVSDRRKDHVDGEVEEEGACEEVTQIFAVNLLLHFRSLLLALDGWIRSLIYRI